MTYSSKNVKSGISLAKRGIVILGALTALGCSGVCGLLPHSPRPEHEPAYTPAALASSTPTPAYCELNPALLNPALNRFTQFTQGCTQEPEYSATPTPEPIVEISFLCDNEPSWELYLRTDILGNYENYGIEAKVLRGDRQLNTFKETVPKSGVLYYDLTYPENYNIGDVLNVEVLLYDPQGNFSSKHISQLTLDELCTQPAPTATPKICPTYAACAPAPTPPTCPVCPPCASPTPTSERERPTPTPVATETASRDRTDEQLPPTDDPRPEPGETPGGNAPER